MHKNLINESDDVAKTIDINFTLFVSVTFFKGKIKTLPNLNNEKYFCDFMIKGENELLKFNIISGDDFCFEKKLNMTALPVSKETDYSKLKPLSPPMIK